MHFPLHQYVFICSISFWPYVKSLGLTLAVHDLTCFYVAVGFVCRTWTYELPCFLGFLLNSTFDVSPLSTVFRFWTWPCTFCFDLSTNALTWHICFKSAGTNVQMHILFNKLVYFNLLGLRECTIIHGACRRLLMHIINLILNFYFYTNMLF